MSVSKEKIEEIVSLIKIPPNDPRFLQRVFSLVAKEQKQLNKDDIVQICTEEYDDLSRRIDRSKIQDSCAVRNVLRTRQLALLLINEKGEIQTELLPRLIQEFKNHLYSFGPGREHDARRQEHLLKVLELLNSHKEIPRILKLISKPFSHPQADQIIRDTLELPEHAPITDAHARQAVLSAWLCYLRQNVGSCFATAPAIIVHDEQPVQFLNDLNELLSTGRLKRTFGGVEYSVPLSVSWGAGDMKKNFILFTGEALEHSEIWQSPGFIAAFEAMGLIDANGSLKQKSDQSKEIITNLYKDGTGSQAIVTNAEEMFHKILLNHLSLTEKNLSDYEKRPTEGMQSALLVHAPLSAPAQQMGKSKTQGCAQFFTLMEKGIKAFKTLADNALLKSWEFTLASFAETKAEFTRWNLYSSLGLGAQEAGGIGPAIYQILQEKINISNQKVADLQSEYETMYSQLKYLEARMQRASEKEVEWLKIEYKTKSYEFYTLEELRDKERNKAQRIAQLYDFLIDCYYELFPQYFQEVYDADMHEVSVGPYDDSPAGFRLLYKYGRANTSQWSYIKNQHEFINALNSFFVATENEIAHREGMEELQKELTEITTSIVTHIKTKEFLESALYRMAAAHNSPIPKNPLEHLDRVEKKPWAYTSGGTMGSLVSCYFRLDQKPTETARWVENPMELLVFLIDTIKQIPPKMMEDFLKENRKSILIHSPTHAFLLKPTYKKYEEAWKNESFTYTWARDQVVKPMERAIEMITLDAEMMEFLKEQLTQLVPEDYRHYFKRTFSRFYGTMTPVEFRNTLVETMSHERGLQSRGMTVLAQEEIDSYLYSILPIFQSYRMKEKLEELFSKIPSLNVEKRGRLLDLFDQLPSTVGSERYTGATTLQEVAKALICLESLETSSKENYAAIIANAARECGYALPEPIVVADSNWMKDDFAFLVNPGTGKLELWRVDVLRKNGSPMTMWDQWLNGSHKDRTWGVYTRPYEYLR